MISEHSDSISRGPAYLFIRYQLPKPRASLGHAGRRMTIYLRERFRLRTAAAIDRAVRNARLIFVQDFWHTTRIPASLARRTMSAVPRPPGNASTRSGLPSSSICWLRLGPPERPKSTR